MYTAFVIIDVFLAIALIALVMIQQGKGADAGAAFGSGSSGTVFGAGGGGSVMAKVTTWIAVAFFAVTLGLSVLAKDRVQTANQPQVEPTSVVQEIPETEEKPPAATADELPVIPEELTGPAGVADIPEEKAPATEMQPPVSSDEVPSVDDIPVGTGDR